MGEQTSVPRVFCGYAHEDKTLFQQLKTSLEKQTSSGEKNLILRV